MADHWPGVMRARRLVAPNWGCGVRSCIGSPHAGPTHGGAPSRTAQLAPANNAYAAPRVDGPARHALTPAVQAGQARQPNPGRTTRADVGPKPDTVARRRPPAPPRGRAPRHVRDCRGERPTDRPSRTGGSARLARPRPEWRSRRRQASRIRAPRPRATGQAARTPWGRVCAATAAHARTPNRAGPARPRSSPAAIVACRVWAYALLAVGDVPVGGGPCLDRRVDRSRGLGEVVDPVDLRLQELAGGRGRHARVRCHALAHAPHVTGGSGAPTSGPVGGDDIGDETGQGAGRRPGSLMARAAARLLTPAGAGQQAGQPQLVRRPLPELHALDQCGRRTAGPEGRKGDRVTWVSRWPFLVGQPARSDRFSHWTPLSIAD